MAKKNNTNDFETKISNLEEMLNMYCYALAFMANQTDLPNDLDYVRWLAIRDSTAFIVAYLKGETSDECAKAWLSAKTTRWNEDTSREE